MNIHHEVGCPAKINLFLEVGEKRADGFHEVRTVIQTLDLYDAISVEEKPGGISLECDHPELPVDFRNLCWRAADLLRREAQSKRGAHIRIKKRIPIAAGLGGGSSDAAGVLILCNKLWKLGLSNARLRRLAAMIGSDVPFFIEGGTALCTGRGEKVSPIEKASSYPFILVTPPVGVSTADIYRSMNGGGVLLHEREQRLIHAVVSVDSLRVARHLYNRLEDSNAPHMNVVRGLKSLLVKHGALGASMSGSGPSVFGIAKGMPEAKRIRREVGREVGNDYFLHCGMTNVKYRVG
jgi:4-diphosphocytidyl-2-C-methyl-D-erythritol kinase